MRLFSRLSPPVKRFLMFGLRLTILIALVAYVLTRVSRQELQQQLVQSDWRLILLGTVLLSVQIPVAAWRWIVILKQLGFQMPAAVAVRLVVIGLFLSQVLPGAVAGDAVRIWLTMKTGCPIKDAVNSVALDRLIMVAVLFLLASLTMLAGSDLPPLLHQPPLAALLIGGTLGGFALIMLADRLPAMLQRWRLFRAAGYLAVDTRATLLNWRSVSVILALSVLSYLNISGCMYLFGLALGQAVDFWPFFLCSLPVFLVSSLPLSIGGWGTREVTAISLLASIGIEPSSAVLISAFFGAGSLLVSLPGLIFLFLGNRQRRLATSSAGGAAH
jgi:uncharacterized membrane protein YbhN (UPF0104 family)